MRTTERFAVALCAFCLLPALSVAQDIQWEKSYGGRHAEYLFDLQPTADYGFILAGSSLSDKTGNKTSPNRGNLDYFVWKMDEKGELQWQKDFGGPGLDLLQCVRTTPDGGFLLAGTSDSKKGDDKKDETLGGNDFWVIKLDAGGGEQWQKTIGGSESDDLVCALALRDGGFLLGGSSESSPIYDKQHNLIGDKKEKSRGNMDYWLVRLDSKGGIKWQKTYGGIYADHLRSMVVTSDNGFLIGGNSNSTDSGDKLHKNNGASDYWILKLDEDGTIEWQKSYGGSGEDQLAVVLQTADGNYMAAGNSNSDGSFNKNTSSRNGSDFWIIKMDEYGNSAWQESYDFGNNDMLSSLIENPDGTFLIGGYARSEVMQGKDKEGISDYIALKIAADGKQLWDRTLGSEGDDMLRKAIETRDGGYILAGTSNPTPKPMMDDRKSKSGLSGISNGQQLAGAKNLQNTIDNTKQDAMSSVNEAYKEQASRITDGVNDAIGQPKDSSLKMGMNAPTDILRNGSGGGQSLDAGKALSGMNQKKQPASRDKKNNFGNNDFWVVKLKDKDKKEKPRTNVEAIPNPARGYTNIIVSYEYHSGSATVYDLAGRQLQQFDLTGDTTVPVNFSNLPEGIYVVEVRTDVATDAVKVMNSK
ncbi:T9SS type A sorting domain-containing protein [Flavobacterium silvaticum]|uniref:T9SS type A sorting domain-containing protein n=1 Tax=Flavobacterium silvaticum TaxID=1852020 RepID=A0A972FID2_9FLAO|nr:T9SS type A sorting domain-containing protein [Flavobacterium silvaticum]NMH26506.1 T9SS type A sorting domain-containing protein [Flavobacterium silvaticum]